jgi:deoxycytidine triphosphate deaminase
MTALSDQDIKRELGKNILIYPFRSKNIKNASYNLTASKLAWSLQTKTSIYQEDQSDNNKPGKLVIPPNTTALIETLETIWVSSRICGTYHSKVALVSKGLGHIGTTLDPEYIGLSLITVHNHSDKDIEIIPEQDTFVSLMFFYVKTGSSCSDNNSPGRPEILNNYNLSSSELQWFDESFRKYPNELKDKLRLSSEYQNLKKSSIHYFLASIVLGIILASIFILYIIFIKNESSWKSASWYSQVISLLNRGLVPLASVFLTQLANDINNRKNDIGSSK